MNQQPKFQKDSYIKHVLPMLLILGTTQSFAGDFQWCRSIDNTPLSEISSAKVPNYPDDFAEQAHRMSDGEWTYDIPISEV